MAEEVRGWRLDLMTLFGNRFPLSDKLELIRESVEKENDRYVVVYNDGLCTWKSPYLIVCENKPRDVPLFGIRWYGEDCNGTQDGMGFLSRELFTNGGAGFSKAFR